MFGYRQFTLGGFTFRRDEYFAHVSWPTGSHVVSIDGFLRALQRDCAWDFFYGTVNFDDVIGTVNHYGTVDLFAGRYNDSYRKAELDHTENFPTPDIRATFKAMLDDWTNTTFDPFASPEETAGPWGLKNGSNTAAVTRRRVAAQRMVGVPGDEQIRSDATHPINRMFADVSQDEPEVHANPGLRGRGRRVQPVRLPVTLGRDVEPERHQRVQGQPVLPDDRGVHPADHPRQRPRRVVRPALRRDPLERRRPRHRSPRAKVIMRAGDVAAMPADIRHRGYSPKRSMLLVWENASPELPELIATGKAPQYPIDF